jgi:hypothetical protein
MEELNPTPTPPGEPSVLDYLKSKLSPRKHPAVSLPPLDSSLPAGTEPPPTESDSSTTEISHPRIPLNHLPWRSLVALALALLAQFSLEPHLNRDWKAGAFLYALSLAWLIWAVWKDELALAPYREEDDIHQPDTGNFRLAPLIACGIFSLLAFLDFKGNLFTSTNLLLWTAAIISFLLAFWTDQKGLNNRWTQFKGFIKKPAWNYTITRDLLLLAGLCLVIVFFRVYETNQVPPEMISDHAEKLLDVQDVLDGQTHIFFPRNTGREAFQFYLIALTVKLFGTGVSFLSMKIGTILFGLLTLPFIYLLGKELGGKRVGILAAAFAGIAYWPNVITRLALRFTFYPFFVAPTLYFLVRGLRRSSRNDIILSGIFLGLGLHSYTPIRILPLVVLVAFILYLIHRQSKGARETTLYHFAILTLAALVLFLPLMRYAMENPTMFALRSFTRLSTWERPLPGPAWSIFLKNLWNAMIMFGWNNGNVWASSIPYRPALDVISAAFFYTGFVLLIIRYILRRHWLDLFLVLSGPLLMLPSILSLAFPEENPNLSRTGGAIVVVFIIIGLSVDAFMNSITKKLPTVAGKRLTWGLLTGLFVLAALQNYNLVFNQYRLIFETSSWNTTELGQVVRAFTQSMGSPDNVWVVAYPYWVDTRLVGINSGFPRKDYGIWPKDLSQTENLSGAKLFLINPSDNDGVSILQQMYPQGWLQSYDSALEGKDFLVYLVPPQ